jgi:hypothetical protein
VQVEDLLGESLARLYRREPEGEDGGSRDPNQAETAQDQPPAHQDEGPLERRGGSGERGHSSTTKANARAARVTNTMS